MIENHFGREVAEHYDENHGHDEPQQAKAAVEVLQELANGEPALEFAIGTGRIALPLVNAGIPITGIELSEEMVAELRKKEGGKNVPVTIGDMATTRVPGTFNLVFLVFNTITNLTTQDGQTACFQNAAAHLKPGGRFLIETSVPPLQQLPVGETQRVFDRSESHWGVDDIDVTTQRCTSHHIWIDEEGMRRFSLPFRYVWPSELDLMARIAGLQLEHRWADWDRRPFTKESGSHISVWRKPST